MHRVYNNIQSKFESHAVKPPSPFFFLPTLKPSIPQVDVISPSHEVSLVVARPLADLEAALPNVTRAISSLAGIKVLCSAEQGRAVQHCSSGA